MAKVIIQIVYRNAEEAERIETERVFQYTRKTFDILRKFLGFVGECMHETADVQTEFLNRIRSDQTLEDELGSLYVSEIILRVISKTNPPFLRDWFVCMQNSKALSRQKFASFKTTKGYIYEIQLPTK